MKYLRLILMLCLFSVEFISLSCTSVIISGKYTRDGRPILWKHRDTGDLQNAIMYFRDGKYEYIGLINSNDKIGESVWVGYNSAGFAIMNTASYNLIAKDTIDVKDQEGILMRLALKECASVEEFEKFLQKLPKPMGVEANFGVIDAQGGAAFFEVDNFGYKKLDVNDPNIAPFGYLIHTNFSFTGDVKKGAGHIRYKTAEDLFFEAAQQNNLTVRFILQNVSRSLWHSFTKTDLRTHYSPFSSEQKFVFFKDFIPRYFTSAVVAIEGVKPGENVEYTTMWTLLGFPLTTVLTPLWLCEAKNLPTLVALNNKDVAPLCDKAMKLKDLLFPVQRNYGEEYININALYNGDNTGIMQKLKPLDDLIFDEAEKKMAAWRNNKNFKKEIPAFYQWLDETISREYLKLFGIP
jgi:hypothetical protein